MKGAYARYLQDKKQEQAKEDVQNGFNFALCLCAVALNEEFGFGRKRIERLEKEVQYLMDNEFKSVELGAYRLARRVEQIRERGAKKEGDKGGRK
jgi:hypothetical protein